MMMFVSCASKKKLSIADILPPVESLDVGKLNQDASKNTLSPFPLYFTPLGEPRESQTVTVDGISARIKWDGHTVSLKLIGGGNSRPPTNGRGGNGNGGGNNRWNWTPNDDDDDDKDKNKDSEDPEHYNTLNKFPEMAWLGCLVLIVGAIVFWWAIYLLWRWLF